MTTQQDTTATLARAEQVDDLLGQRVRVVGIAQDAKLAAHLTTDAGLGVYCIDLQRWPEHLRGQRVEATGTLRRTDRFAATVDEDGAISQGTAGGDLILEECSYQEAP